MARTVLVAVCAIALLGGLTGPWPAVPVVAVLGLVVGCWPILAEAWGDIRHRRMSMELSMLLAIVAAAAVGEWSTALVVTVFVLAAEILEDLSMDRGRDALTDLMSFLPSDVQVRDGDQVRTVPLDEIRVGQTVIVSPGGRVPVDGTVVAGRSSLDQSRITGESMPVDVAVGDRVYAGSVNQVGAVEVAAEKVGAQSSYGQVIDAVRGAQSSQAPVQHLADRLAAYLVYLALGGALVTYLITRDITATISVVIVAGACGIAAGTPLAVLGAIGRAARTGAFIKDGTHLEALSTVDTIIFDKTGTLTEGHPQVAQITPGPGHTEGDVLAAAAAAELYSEHPLGQAITAHARARDLRVGRPESFDYEPGRGLSAHVDGRLIQVGNTTLVPGAPASTNADPEQTHLTPVHVAVDGRFIGTIYLADSVRASARRCVDDLRAMGLRVVMLTGDSRATANAIAAQLGIEEVRAELLPGDKLAAITTERTAGHTVAMIGDGVNDAPALARADVGIAMGSGTEVARQSADIVLISSDLSDLTSTVQVARRTRRIVMTNFIGTIAIDLIGMTLAAFGLLGPVLAAIVHVGSESAFILNSARLISGRRTRRERSLP
ncbi:heavy metal translocating P-type ATPase [Pengzhenrongella frigida]|uniref:Cadmium-translocating P-type ATPase n=1 Tax=Pengzhenrongella frigida TaxID=1259133 RepID=A0A4Q5MYT6_9MICO|nr:cation-translocating P-type ATPase [Cellulomonas sp. HLT2-17]RYV49407.1 cadmium-translocating P-type ATPase [Cellulomonas sp. HLT2-17]